MEYYKLVRELFEVFKECHLQVKKEKCFPFYTQVKYVGHILHEGQRSPTPGKVAAVHGWSKIMIRTPKQMKSFLGICDCHWRRRSWSDWPEGISRILINAPGKSQCISKQSVGLI